MKIQKIILFRLQKSYYVFLINDKSDIKVTLVRYFNGSSCIFITNNYEICAIIKILIFLSAINIISKEEIRGFLLKCYERQNEILLIY